MPSLSLLTLNIANPSVERAHRQLAWLARRDEDVFVLTETKAKASEGCRLLAGAFHTSGYAVMFPELGPGEYGTMIASKVRAKEDHWNEQLGYLTSRAATAVLPAPLPPMRGSTAGLAVPATATATTTLSAQQASLPRWWPVTTCTNPAPAGPARPCCSRPRQAGATLAADDQQPSTHQGTRCSRPLPRRASVPACSFSTKTTASCLSTRATPTVSYRWSGSAMVVFIPGTLPGSGSAGTYRG